MMQLTFITGNQDKADYLAKWLGVAVPHQKIDLPELQSLELADVVAHKAREAYAQLGTPVLVEDVALSFAALGALPGTYIKWFLQEIGNEGMLRMLQGFDDRRATARIMYGLYDGTVLHTFSGETQGTVPLEARSSEVSSWKSSKSWNAIFIPDGSHKSYAEMTDEELQPFSHRAQAIAKLRTFIDK